MKSSKLKMVCLSDLHFGNPRITADQIYCNLRTYLYPELENTHLLFICGDLYDQLQTVNSKAHKYVSKFIKDLLIISANTGMQVRILHGTYSHDREQLDVLNTLQFKGSRFKVISKIDVEELKDFRFKDNIINAILRVGYLPDNLPNMTSTEVIAQLKTCMNIYSWSKLDLVIGHGSFEHIFKDTDRLPTCLYSISQFQDILNHNPIIMGHIHSPGKYMNCYYCGSFERMTHGEEEDKGFYVFTKDINNGYGWESKFIVNKNTTPFITIEPKGVDVAEISADYVKQVREKFPDLSKPGHVRVLHEDRDIRSQLHRLTAATFPTLFYSSKRIGEITQSNNVEMVEVDLTEFDELNVSESNLSTLIIKYLEDNGELGDISKENITSKVKALIRGNSK